MRYLAPALLACCLLLTGCYQAQMTTGRDASETVVEKKWASSFLFGLVPARVDVSNECTNGIAEAERKMSFLNMVVSGLTFNIYSPQSVTVTCATGGSMSAHASATDFSLSTDATVEDIRAVLHSASTHATITQQPATVHLVAE